MHRCPLPEGPLTDLDTASATPATAAETTAETTGGTTDGTVTAGLPLRRAAATVRGAGAEAAALAHHLVRYPTGIPPEPRPRPCPPDLGADRPARGPVLLLHGLADNRAVFRPLRRELHRHGWTHLHALNYSPLIRDVRAAAALLARHVAWAAEAHPGGPVTLVGHSLGGLICRYYVQRLGGDGPVRTVVTLGTPHAGTTAALLPTPFPIIRQLRPGSELLTELRLPAPRCRARFTVLRGELDEVVLPGRSAWLDHPDLRADNLLIPGAGHIGLPAHPLAVEAVRRALEAQDGAGVTERQAS
ncbi:alpha/beta fold hydrolase [Kitasatospora sp. NBC_00374]|uniref:esterase/lipase family protein n=1 Tax=Kitasatospora sp. NBC_00374 TaxID=2975964 RepID=UPI003249C51C